ncbi:MAG TPA: NAD(P)-dependent oxidoreductase, partial [Nitrosopumilaceae archaeon]|nr:NAD(P)-dependent oxidoreductase [Nitrosopumilaceae archaeon]
MKVKILKLADGLEEIFSLKLRERGFIAEIVDYNRPLFEQIADSDVLINGLGNIDSSLINACTKLKMIHQIGIGVDGIDFDYCASKSIYVANVPKNNAVSVAEFTLFLMIYLAKNMGSASGSIMKRRVLSIMGSELQGKTLFIIGLGYTGSEVAKRAKAFGMRVLAMTRNPTKPEIDKRYLDELIGPHDFLKKLPEADYISIHIPLTNETRNMIDTREFNLMKKTAYLVNVARAAVVDKDALFDALTSGKIAGAAFDVFWQEPADPSDRMLNLDGFFLTQHVAGWSTESVDGATKIIATNIERISQ